MMTTFRSVSNETDMGVDLCLNEKQSTCQKNCTNSNYGECDLSKAVKLVFGTCKCRFCWKVDDCSKRDERKKSRMLGCKQ